MSDRVPVFRPALGPGSPLLAATDKPARAKPVSAEAPVQRNVVTLYASCGMSCWVNSVYGTQPHGVTPGIPDMRVKQPDWRLDFDHETKPDGRRQSKSQYDYLRECQAMGTVYVLGGVAEAIDFLDFLGIVAKRLPDTAQFKPRESWRSYMDWCHERPWLLADAWYASPAFVASIAKHGYRHVGRR